MINIEYKENSDKEIYNIIDEEFEEFANKNGIKCNYMSFAFVAKDNDKIVGVITGKSYYKEVHISDLIVLEQYRNKRIGSKLLETVEKYYSNKGFGNINLTTYGFQAPEFYKKCGFKEYGRRRKCYFLNGKYYDKIEMDILAEEFKEEYIRNKNIK